ncbi:hypothetical protein [Atlantibacter hermannii]|uniref:hypothetical protein n=1 Tax=Atlantibacter hermannii TaxID=565 RepID=UPI0028AE18FA|nr:hypothetical protein [Atlantibacter hermannii]
MSEEKSVGFKISGCLDVRLHDCKSLGAATGFDISGAETLSISNTIHLDKEVMLLFSKVHSEINASALEDSIKKELLTKLNDSMSAPDKKESAAKYTNFISSAAEHLTIIGTAWPMLKELGLLLSS